MLCRNEAGMSCNDNLVVIEHKQITYVNLLNVQQTTLQSAKSKRHKVPRVGTAGALYHMVLEPAAVPKKHIYRRLIVRDSWHCDPRHFPK